MFHISSSHLSLQRACFEPNHEDINRKALIFPVRYLKLEGPCCEPDFHHFSHLFTGPIQFIIFLRKPSAYPSDKWFSCTMPKLSDNRPKHRAIVHPALSSHTGPHNSSHTSHACPKSDTRIYFWWQRPPNGGRIMRSRFRPYVGADNWPWCYFWEFAQPDV